MSGKVKEYWSDDIVVTFDAKRCIHAAECLRGLPAVFDTGKRPWVQPGNASADEVAQVVMRCPSGALHYRRKDGGAEEPTPQANQVVVGPRGPLYLAGDVEVVLAGQEEPLADTRLVLCRCGASQNKPFCDNSHRQIGFSAGGDIGESKVRVVAGQDTGGKLRVTPTTNGSLQLEGDFTLRSGDGLTVLEGNRAFLCRCGGSANKPFCDGTHRRIGFQAE